MDRYFWKFVKNIDDLKSFEKIIKFQTDYLTEYCIKNNIKI